MLLEDKGSRKKAYNYSKTWQVTKEATNMKTPLLVSILSTFYMIETHSSTTNLEKAITSVPGIQGKSQGQSCTFQWTVNPPQHASYTVHNFTTGISLPLNERANYTVDLGSGVVNLTIREIQMCDAGNYSLSVTVGNRTETDSSALLFFYGEVDSIVRQTSHPIPAAEGERVELTCLMTSTSIPVAYRPKTEVHLWASSKGWLSNIGNGSVANSNGVIFPGYSFKDDERTLVIDSIQCQDLQFLICKGREASVTGDDEDIQIIGDIHRYRDEQIFITHTYIKCKPHVEFPNSKNGKIYAALNEEVILNVQLDSTFSLRLNSSWSFVSAAGCSNNLPPTAFPFNCRQNDHHIVGLAFEMTSRDFYGNYTVTVENSLGSATETIQVLPPVSRRYKQPLQEFYGNCSNNTENTKKGKKASTTKIPEVSPSGRPQVVKMDQWESKIINRPISLYAELNLRVEIVANNNPAPNSSWSFVNVAGCAQDLPPDAHPFTCRGYRGRFLIGLAFDFASEESYGSYTVTVENAAGSTNETFYVLPPGYTEFNLTSQEFYGNCSNNVESSTGSISDISESPPPPPGSSGSSLHPAIVVLSILFGIAVVLLIGTWVVFYVRNRSKSDWPLTTEQRGGSERLVNCSMTDIAMDH